MIIPREEKLPILWPSTRRTRPRPRAVPILTSALIISLRVLVPGSIHIAANGFISFFLWLSDSPVRVCTPHLCPFIRRWAFGYFHILATVNSAAMNIEVRVSF